MTGSRSCSGGTHDCGVTGWDYRRTVPLLMTPTARIPVEKQEVEP